jgi:secreted trypsin-like serine protease
MRRTAAALACSLFLYLPAAAMVGGAEEAPAAVARHVVLLVNSRGASCSGVAIARDVVLTAAHCLAPDAEHKLVEFGAGPPALKDIASIQRHPQFDAQAAARHRVTADMALVKLAAPLPARIVAAPLAAPSKAVTAGDLLLVAGYGVAVPGDGKSGGKVRSAKLMAWSKPGTLQIRLVDPVRQGERPGLGACTGDSGAPVFEEADGRLAVLGLVSWTTGPALSAGCGGITGVTPLMRYRDWIVQTAKTLGARAVQ